MQQVHDILTVTGRCHGHEFKIGEKVIILEVDNYDDDLPYLCETLDGGFRHRWWLGDGEFEVEPVELPLAKLQREIYEGNVAAGWWEDLNTGKPYEKGNVMLILMKLALVHSEVSEALEGVRKGLMDDKLPHRPMAEVEIADAIIRLLDLAGHEGYDVAGAIAEKLAYNAQREDHKKEHRLTEGGKKA